MGCSEGDALVGSGELPDDVDVVIFCAAASLAFGEVFA